MGGAGDDVVAHVEVVLAQEEVAGAALSGAGGGDENEVSGFSGGFALHCFMIKILTQNTQMLFLKKYNTLRILLADSVLHFMK